MRLGGGAANASNDDDSDFGKRADEYDYPGRERKATTNKMMPRASRGPSASARRRTRNFAETNNIVVTVVVVVVAGVVVMFA